MQKLFIRLSRATNLRTSHHWWPWCLILALAIGTTFPQWYNHAYFWNSDGYFHAARCYDTMKQLQTGKGDYFISTFGFNHCGRTINAVYGPLAAYANGALLLLTGNWITYQLVLTMLLHSIAGLSVYRLLRLNQVRTVTSTLTACLYMMSNAVFSWTETQAFSYYGAAFLPLILLQAAHLFRNNGRPVRVRHLALTMALLLQIHFVTAFMAGLIYAACWLLAFPRLQHRWRVLWATIRAAVLTGCLTLNLWASLYEVMGTNQVMPLERIATPEKFTLAQLINDSPWYSTTNIIVLPLLVILPYGCLYFRRLNYFTRATLICGFGFLFLASPLFPWASLTEHNGFFQAFQYPYRFYFPATLLLLVSGALILRDRWTHGDRLFFPGLFLVTLVMLISVNMSDMWARATCYRRADTFEGTIAQNRATDTTYGISDWHTFAKPYAQTNNGDAVRAAVSSAALDRALDVAVKGITDYLPTDQPTFDKACYQQFSDEVLLNTKLSDTTPIRNGMICRWQQDTATTCTLPLVAYHHTQLTLNGELLVYDRDYTINRVGAVVLRVPAGDNQLVVHYEPTPWVMPLIRLTPLCWLVVIAARRWQRRKRQPNRVQAPGNYRPYIRQR